jgi:superfamily II DNA or RNA helicase
MSRKISLNNYTDKELELYSKDLTITKEPSKYARNAKPEILTLFDIDKNEAYIPFSYNTTFSRPERKELPATNVEFNGKLRENQEEIKIEAIHSLNRNGSVMISCYCGFGKSITALCIASKIKLKTLIVCHRVILLKQWEEAIKTFCPTSKVQVLTPKSVMKDADFFIINGANIFKKGREFFSSIGTLIVDEAHLIMADKLSNCMKFITPRYVIGLSATPYRTDGLDVLLDLYFGQEKIVRKLYKPHTVYLVETKIKPEFKTNNIGKIDWGSLIDSVSNNEKRNLLIVDIIKKFKDRVFLVLCKRVSQANFLCKRLKEEKEDVTSLIGKNQEFLKESRILIGTTGKLGTGFDHPRLDSMILASDVEQYFVQFLGRIFRRQDVEPLIFDILDDHPILFKHFKTRREVYTEHGGVVKKYI